MVLVLPDRDHGAPARGRLGQGHGQEPVLDSRGHPGRVHRRRQAQAADEDPAGALGVMIARLGLPALLPLDREQTVLQGDLDVLPLQARHLEGRHQAVPGLGDVEARDPVPQGRQLRALEPRDAIEQPIHLALQALDSRPRHQPAHHGDVLLGQNCNAGATGRPPSIRAVTARAVATAEATTPRCGDRAPGPLEAARSLAHNAAVHDPARRGQVTSWLVRHRVAFEFAVAAGFLVAIAIVAISARDLIEQYEAVRRGSKIEAELDSLRSVITDAETGQRGFLLTGDERYLARSPLTASGDPAE